MPAHTFIWLSREKLNGEIYLQHSAGRCCIYQLGTGTAAQPTFVLFSVTVLRVTFDDIRECSPSNNIVPGQLPPTIHCVIRVAVTHCGLAWIYSFVNRIKSSGILFTGFYAVVPVLYFRSFSLKAKFLIVSINILTSVSLLKLVRWFLVIYLCGNKSASVSDRVGEMSKELVKAADGAI